MTRNRTLLLLVVVLATLYGAAALLQFRQHATVSLALTLFQGLITLCLACVALSQYRQRVAARAQAEASKLDLMAATARLQTEAVQQAARDALQEVTQALPLIVYRMRRDAAGRPSYTYISERVRTLMGASPQEVMDNPGLMDSIVHPEDKAKVAQAVGTALATLQPYAQQFRVVLPTGHTHWVYCESVPRRQADGSVWSTGYLQVIDDVKERETRLHEIMDQQDVIFDSISSGLIFVVDGVIRRFNPSFAAMVGLEGEDLVGQGVSRFFASSQAFAAFMAIYVPRLDQGLQVVEEREVHRADGSRFLCRGTGRKVNVAEAGRATLWVLDDVTAQRQIEADLRRAHGLAEEASRLKSDFLANVSHEIRTPMNAIIGMSHLALQTELGGRQRGYVDKIHQSGQHLLKIIDDLLDFSSLASGELAIQSRVFTLDEVLDTVAGAVADQAVAKGLALVCDVTPQTPNLLVGDPVRLGQVLIHYLNNAIKFTQAGQVGLSVQAYPRADAQVLLQFDVRDTGIGLTPEQKARLFQGFQQADTSARRKYGGTGLGLAISKALAEAMGGAVGVESVAGEGANFWFTACVGVAPQAAGAADHGTRRGAWRVMAAQWPVGPVNFTEVTEATAASIDPDTVRETCRTFAALLADNDSAASDMLDDKARLLQTALGEDYRAIENHVRQYDFEAALEALHAALVRLGIVF